MGIEQSRNPWMTVVGVVGDMNQSALGIDPIAQTYEPIWRQPDARPVWTSIAASIYWSAPIAIRLPCWRRFAGFSPGSIPSCRYRTHSRPSKSWPILCGRSVSA
jgi:hypothetical protein